MERLKKLIDGCKCGIHLEINVHRNYYETVEQYFKSNDSLKDDLREIEPNIYDRMVELDSIVELRCYPFTPISFFNLYHYDVEKAIEEALKRLDILNIKINKDEQS